MKRLLLATTALLLVIPDIAMAQAKDHKPGGGGRPGMTKPAPAVRPQPARPNPGRPNPGRPEHGKPRPPGNLVPLPKPVPGRPNPGNGHRPNPGNGHRPNPGNGHRPNPGNGHRPNPGWQHRPGTGRPPNFRPVHRPPFRYPHGWAYRRWTIGLFLPSLFLSNSYYFDDWAPLGVGAPPPGYRWVRYGPDLLLVQIGTRRIVDVIYGAFY